MPLKEIINKIEIAIGEQPSNKDYDDEDYFLDQPDWFSKDKIKLSINEEKLENKNQMTLATILLEAKDINKKEIIELITTFLPAPGIDILKSKGYSVWSKKLENGLVKSYFLKN